MPEIVIGILVSLFVFEITRFSPGGIITAGYLALYIHRFDFIGATLGVSLLTWCVIQGLKKYMVLYGKRLFSVYLLIGLLISQGIPVLLDISFDQIEFITIGYLLPGLIAKDADRQGWLPTLSTLLLSVGLIRLVILFGKGWLW